MECQSWLPDFRKKPKLDQPVDSMQLVTRLRGVNDRPYLGSAECPRGLIWKTISSGRGLLMDKASNGASDGVNS